MTGNHAVADKGPGKVEVIDVPYPDFELHDGPGVNPANVGREVNHGVILKTVATNICGSDQHMVRGRTTAPSNLVLGHEITGEVVETGSDVEFIHKGDIVSVPFNIACGRCRNCKEGTPGLYVTARPNMLRGLAASTVLAIVPADGIAAGSPARVRSCPLPRQMSCRAAGHLPRKRTSGRGRDGGAFDADDHVLRGGGVRRGCRGSGRPCRRSSC